MRQHITPKQAKQLTKEQFYSLFPDLVIRDDWANYHHKKITIGKIIEILKDKGVKIEISICTPFKIKDLKNDREYYDTELCNVLLKVLIDNIQ